MQLTKTGTRSSAGTTATDGWLNFNFSESFTLGSNYTITAVYAKFTAIRSASGQFTGDVPVKVVTSSGEYDLGEITGYTFPASTTTAGTTISGYLSVSQSTLTALKTATIQRIDLGQSTYAGGKDIRCLASSTAEFTLVYDEITPVLTAPTNLKIVQNSDGTFTASWDAATVTNGSASNIRYQLWDYDKDDTVSNIITSTSVTCPITTYGVATSYYIASYYNGYPGINASSDPVTVTFTDKLPIWYNGEQVTELYFNGAKVLSLDYNGITIY